MRYHVISLVAVFLALAIGILLGTTLVERGLIAELRSEIGSLKETFSEVKEKNESLNSELDTYGEYAVQSMPYMLPNRLAGRIMAVITGREPDEEKLEAVHAAVAAAGGTVPLTVNVLPSDTYENPAILEGLAALFGLPPDAQVIRERVLAELVGQLKTATNPAVIQTLEQMGVIRVRGVLSGPVSGAVLMASIELTNNLENTDLPLIRTAAALEFPVVAVDGRDTPESVLVSYKKNGISTVDHIGTVPGQVALVLVLEGRSGNYGSGSAADRVLPEP